LPNEIPDLLNWPQKLLFSNHPGGISLPLGVTLV
jgi:hypothetical protein